MAGRRMVLGLSRKTRHPRTMPRRQMRATDVDAGDVNAPARTHAPRKGGVTRAYRQRVCFFETFGLTDKASLRP